jgi:hypothetical protein
MPVFYEAPRVNIESAEDDIDIASILEAIADSPVTQVLITHWPPAIGAFIIFLLVRKGYERAVIPAAAIVLILDAWHFRLFT